MTTKSGLPFAIDVNLTEIMERERIRKVERYLDLFSVVLLDGRLGIAPTVGEALAKAKMPDADNVLKVAA